MNSSKPSKPAKPSPNQTPETLLHITLILIGINQIILLILLTTRK